MTNKRNLPVLTDEEMAEKIRKSIENGERRMKLVRKLREAFEEAKKRDRSFERALHFRADMLKLEKELFEALVSKESEE